MNSSPTRFWRFIPFWPLGLVAVVGLLWWKRIAIVVWLAGLVPLPGNLQITNLQLHDINLNQARITTLELVQRVPDPGDEESLKLAGENLVVGYQLFGEHGFSVNSVHIGQVNVRVSEARPGSDPEATLGTLLRGIRKMLQRPLPELNLSADRLLVEHSQQQVLAEPLAVVLHSTGSRATVTASYGNKQANLRIGAESQSIGSVDKENSLSSQPTSSGQSSGPQQVLALSLVATESGINLDADINLDQLYPLASELGVLTASYPDNQSLPDSIQLQVELGQRHDAVIMDFSLQPLDIATGQLTISGIQGSGRVTISANQKPRLPITLQATEGLEIKAERARDNENDFDDLSLKLYGALTLARGNFDITLTDRSRLEVAAAAVSLAGSALQINQFSLIPPLSATAGEISLQPGFSIQANSLARNELVLENLTVTPIQPANLPTELGLLAGKPLGNWRVHTGVRLSDLVALDARLHLNIIDPDPDHFNLAFIGEHLQFSIPRHFPKVRSAEMELTSVGSVLSGQGRVDLAALQNSLDITLDHDPGEDNTRATVTSAGKEPVRSLLTMLDNFLLEVPPEIAVSSGSAGFTAEAIWTDSHNKNSSVFKLKLAGNDISGRVDEVAFLGLALDINAALTPTGRLNGDVYTTLDSIDYGLTVRDINSEFGFASTATGPLPALDFESLSGTLFDSRFYSDPFDLDLNNPETRFVVRVDNLDIEKLVATQGIDHLSASGRVTGAFPVYIDHQGVTITNGTVTNLPGGGRIQYDISNQQARALDNPLTDIVITALRDFRYDVLTADTNYHPDGELFIDFHLEGTSPKLDPDRQVNLNINTRQNVLSLLRSLNYSDGLNQTIDQQIQDNVK